MGRLVKVVRESEGRIYAQETCRATMLLTSDNVAARHMDLGILHLKPHSKTLPNTHPRSEEMFYVLKGEGTITVADETEAIEAGVAIYIPPNVVHHFENTQDEEMVFVLMHAPPEAPEDIADSPWTEEDSP
jgi:mannose-6-phosphate isomerase-like protein (cupin superfamily)